ncbi:MAG: bifunctional oligoribonuclease/PAP phosphatase NrnA [Deltaproteobacteria bacterium]|nr:bifunctional oligoribonuclease/PAP phosphatase NrnA [Deltaproteobacteria bacterium]
MDNYFNKVIDEINKGERFLVASHINPEGDAVGSALAMALGLKKLGKYSKVFFHDNVPHTFKFLDGAMDVVHKVGDDEIFDAAIVVDCGQLDRLGDNFETIKNKGKIINIDHHITNNLFGDINFVIPEASSTGEIVYDLLNAMDVKITKDIAVNIYTSVLTDTGSFRYSSTTPHALVVAAEMIKAGVDPWDISQRIYESYPAKRFKLLGMVLDTLEVSEHGKIAVLVVTQDMLKRADADKELTEGFVNFARAIDGVEVGILFRESKSGEYKMSFRSRGNIDVAEIGSMFGGGGHKNAAGCNLQGTLEEVKEKILSATIEKIGGGK